MDCGVQVLVLLISHKSLSGMLAKVCVQRENTDFVLSSLGPMLDKYKIENPKVCGV